MMMQEDVNSRELVSALADGQLQGDEFARTVEWVTGTQEARLTWRAYHVVGDVLRAGEAMDSSRDTAFIKRLQLGLQQPETAASKLIATDIVAGHAAPTAARGLKHLNMTSANDAVFRWKLLAGLASLATVSVVAWQVAGGWGDQRGESQLAQGPSGQAKVALQQSAVGAESQVMIRDPQLDALLAAHRQFGGTSALQMPAGFLRNATFEEAAR